jgi:hypothetical protein
MCTIDPLKIDTKGRSSSRRRAEQAAAAKAFALIDQ